MAEFLSTNSLAPAAGTSAGQATAPAATDAVSLGPWQQLRRWSTSGRSAIAIRGGAWSIVGYAATQLLRTLATLVLARHFLGPETFGVVGLVAVFISGLSMFSELGIVASVVQHRRGDSREFLNTAFSIQAGRGVVIWGAAALAAYPLALFYKQPELLPLLVVSSLSELARGLTSTAAWTLNRDVKLRNLTLLTIASEVVGVVLSIAWAVVSPSPWALVVRSIASAVVLAIGSHFITDRSVKFQWEGSAAKDILHFGGWISISTAAHFLASQGERLILGKFITAAELGCFSLALMISSLPAAGIGQLVNQIYLPMISKTVRTSQTETVQDFLQARRWFFAAAVFIGLGFLALGHSVVVLLLPPKYAMTGWMLQLLGLRVAFDVFAAPASSLILAYGESRFAARANSARLILMVSGVWIAFARFGMREAVLFLVIAQALSYYPLVFGLRKVLPQVARNEFRQYGMLLAILTVAVAIWWRIA